MPDVVHTIYPSCADRGATCGHWDTEREAEDHLESFLLASGLFAVYRQVPGRPLWTHHFQAMQEVRADLLLLPNDRFIQAGWTGGAIVIEVKRSGERIGPGLSQLLDYLNTAWRIPETGGTLVIPGFGLLFPAESDGGPIASIMAQQHIGTAWFERGGRLQCSCGHSRLFSIRPDGELRIGQLNFGLKAGSR